MVIKTQSVTPKTSGFTPTIFITERDKPAPIKKRVNVKHCRATVAIPCVKKVGIAKSVFDAMACINSRINQGKTIFDPFDLK